MATRRKSLSRTELRGLAARCLRRVRRDVRDGFTSEAEAGVATERLACVTRELMVVSVQRRERADRRATRDGHASSGVK